MTIKSQPVQIATADGNEAVIAGGLQPGALARSVPRACTPVLRPLR
jgi:multidrug efflux system membrane fusion protein